MTDFLTLARTRQSCRAFEPRPVEREKITACLEAARLSPSGCNSQPWRYTVTDDPVLTGQIAAAVQGLGLNRFAYQVPAFAVVTEEKAELLTRLAERMDSQTFAQIDIGLSAAHFVLEAVEQGLGVCILGWFDEEKLKQILRIPEGKKVRLVICIGYPAEQEPRQKLRKPLEEISEWVEGERPL